MDNQKMNEAIGSLSSKIADLKKQGASGQEIQGAVFEMLQGLGLNIPLDKITQNMNGGNKNDE
ncbi:hypothetical protein KDJ21_015695 [Metabacillus litoralis]|uniref:hypothetical protein n=1 Tax=Metabacillus TaxID=2675233 RepID=UPI000EF6034F|nr:hypothetical protein [Metabacillus litoralis]MCM3163876.1 hypothetical protein [Metabacillus litoralis]MCM3410611.1 hypothetical protein [Metabacillus litoralis]UHA58302.1 hypothetical protein KDJ21_015695 [Metabacillus litoralis]